jgi:hypothetical protein
MLSVSSPFPGWGRFLPAKTGKNLPHSQWKLDNTRRIRARQPPMTVQFLQTEQSRPAEPFPPSASKHKTARGEIPEQLQTKEETVPGRTRHNDLTYTPPFRQRRSKAAEKGVYAARSRINHWQSAGTHAPYCTVMIRSVKEPSVRAAGSSPPVYCVAKHSSHAV